MTTAFSIPTAKELNKADRSQLIEYYRDTSKLRDNWIRKQVLENNRIDILAKEVLGLQLKPFHILLLQFQFLHPENLQLCGRGFGKTHLGNTTFLMFDGSIKKACDIKNGDLLMGPDSFPRRVIETHTVLGTRYKITPFKGESFVCNEHHEIPLFGRRRRNIDKLTTFTAPELIEKTKNRSRGIHDFPWKLKRTGIEFIKQEKELPFDPYLIGLWIGDGTTSEAHITNPEPEIEKWVRKWCLKNNYDLSILKKKGCNRLSLTTGKQVNPFRRWIRKHSDKRIPKEYLLSSKKNRLQLLAALIDTDGYLGKSNGLEITQSRHKTALDILFLCRSLGFAAYIKEKETSIKSTGYKGVTWRISISGDIDTIPCIVSRKIPAKRKITKNHLIVGIKSIKKQWKDVFYGFQVVADNQNVTKEYEPLIVRGDFTIDHNSTVCTEAKIIHLLLKNPNLRILIASKTIQNACGFLKNIKAHFETNQRLEDIFGKYYDPRKVNKWDEREIEVLPRTIVAKEASVTCIGVEGTVVSKHYDVIISDDLIDEDNSTSKTQRDKIRTWFYNTLMPTLEPPDRNIKHRGEHHMLGTRYHYDDLYGHLIDNELKNHHNIVESLDEKLRSPWPEKFPPEWLLEKRRRSGIIIFNAQYQNNTEAMKGEIFQYDHCQQLTEDDWPDHKKLRIFMGVDLAITEEEKNDKFAIVVIGVTRDRSAYFVLDYFEDQIRFVEQTKKIVEYYKRWKPIRCKIETNQYQLAQYQVIKKDYPDMRVVKHQTDKDKVSRAWKLSAIFEDLRVFFRKGIQALLIEHLVLFPNHKYKDLFDAFDLAVQASKMKKGNRKRDYEPGVI